MDSGDVGERSCLSFPLFEKVSDSDVEWAGWRWTESEKPRDFVCLFLFLERLRTLRLYDVKQH